MHNLHMYVNLLFNAFIFYAKRRQKAANPNYDTCSIEAQLRSGYAVTRKVIGKSRDIIITPK